MDRGVVAVSTVMPVLLDATSLPPSWGGVARYITGLLGGLDELHRPVHVVAKESDIERLRTAAPSHHYVAAPRLISSRPARLAWEQAGLPLLARRLGVRVLHSPHYTSPVVLGGLGSVVTLHDATFFSDPAVHSRLKRTFFRAWSRRAISRADAVVLPSGATRDELVRLAGLRPDRSVVAHLGVDQTVFHVPSAEDVSGFARAHELTQHGWIAFLGTIEPRKNVPALLRAYAEVRTRLGDSAPALVLSGARGWDQEASAMLDSAPSGVREVGYLPLDQLSALLGGSTVVAYPSLGEGFGLPVLEAMASGAAVLTTRRLSLPEVGGDAVAYTEPDAASLADALHRLILDDSERARLAVTAPLRAAGFTWAACARAHLDAYRRAGADV
ncbi:glycosyltransferase family 1 protein [Humibacter sp. BT305]|nr:glycosyltransferase family 1 protein [Humibacter sp. BT305]